MTTQNYNNNLVTSFEFDVQWANIREPYYDKGNPERGIEPKKEYRITLYCDFDNSSPARKSQFLTFLDNILSKRSNYVTGNAEQVIQEAINSRIIWRKGNKFFMQPTQLTDFYSMKNGKEIYCQFPVAVYNPEGEKFEQALIPDIDFSKETTAQIVVNAKPSKKTGDNAIWLELKEVQLIKFTKFYKENKAVEKKVFDAGEVKAFYKDDLEDDFNELYQEIAQEQVNQEDFDDDIPF